MEIKKRIRLTPEQFEIVRNNQKMTAEALAKLLDVPVNTIIHNRHLVKEIEKDQVPKNCFNVKTYLRELVTI